MSMPMEDLLESVIKDPKFPDPKYFIIELYRQGILDNDETELIEKTEGRSGRQASEAAGLFRATAGARPTAAWILVSPPTRIGASIRVSDG